MYVDIACTDPELYPEFDDVVADVIEAALADPNAAGSEALLVVERWRRLFRSKLLQGLSAEARMGLFAELIVLKKFFECDATFDVKDWRGPLNHPHDFEPPRRCVEVKALGATSEHVAIHGLEQLETHDDRPLDLVVINVIAEPDGVSLGDLVAEVRKLAPTPSKFAERLAAAGLQADQLVDYTDRYSIGEVLHVQVSSAVPRLVPSALTTGETPPGVSKVRYSVAYVELTPHASGASLDEVIQGALK
jgi:hypothetical protein